MKIAPVRKNVAAASAVVLLAAACADGEDSSNGDDNGDDANGLPASEMRDWDVDCDWFHLDDFQDFLGFEEWSTGPIEAGIGSGNNPSALTCEASFLWPEFEGPSGYTVRPDATFGYDVYPEDSRDDADELYEHRIDHIHGRYPESEAAFIGSIEGDWLDSHYFVNEYDLGNYYFIILEEEDFALEFSIHIPLDPADQYDEDDLLPGEWAGFEFDQESAADFLFEEQMPNIHDKFMTLLDRKG